MFVIQNILTGQIKYINSILDYQNYSFGWKIYMYAGGSTKFVSASELQTYLDHGWYYKSYPANSDPFNINQGVPSMTDYEKLMEEISAYGPAEIQATLAGNPPTNIIQLLTSDGYQQIYKNVTGKDLPRLDSSGNIIRPAAAASSSLWIVGLLLLGLLATGSEAHE